MYYVMVSVYQIWRPVTGIGYLPQTLTWKSVLISWSQKHQYKYPLAFPCYHASWDKRYSITTSGSGPPSLIYYSPWHSRSVRTIPTVFLDLTNCGFPWKFADISFVLWDISYIWSVNRHFEYVWLWLIILRQLRHHTTCAWGPAWGSQQLCTPPFTLQKSVRCSSSKLIYSRKHLNLFIVLLLQNDYVCPLV